MAVKYYTQVVSTDVAGSIEIPAQEYNAYAVSAPAGIRATIRLTDGGQLIDVTRFPTARFCACFGGRVLLQWGALAGKSIALMLAKDADLSTVLG